MKSTPGIKQIYTGIQHQLNNLIPEKWESIYLYASVINQLNNLETWEMYFYYIPKGLIKKNPINVYEIPYKFNVDEEEYLALVDNLCNTIRKLHKEYELAYGKNWSNMIIAIKDAQFLIEYNDDNLLKSKYTSQDRHMIFKHKYLNIPIQNFNKAQRRIIQDYLENEEYKQVFDRYFEYIPKEEVHNYIEYEKDNGFEEDLYSSKLITANEKRPNKFLTLINLLIHRNKKKVKKLVEPVMEPIFEPKIQILSDK